jgi:hypothetical protein
MGYNLQDLGVFLSDGTSVGTQQQRYDSRLCQF